MIFPKVISMIASKEIDIKDTIREKKVIYENYEI